MGGGGGGGGATFPPLVFKVRGGGNSFKPTIFPFCTPPLSVINDSSLKENTEIPHLHFVD